MVDKTCVTTPAHICDDTGEYGTCLIAKCLLQLFKQLEAVWQLSPGSYAIGFIKKEGNCWWWTAGIQRIIFPLHKSHLWFRAY